MATSVRFQFNEAMVKSMVMEGIVAGITNSADAVKSEAKEKCPVRTNRLRGSIENEPTLVEGTNVSARIGTNVEYASAVENGTSKSVTIVAKNGKCLSWIDKSTGKRLFAKKVTIPPRAGRPYLIPAFNNWKEKYKLVIADEIKARLG